MNTYYGELEKERRLTDALEERLSYTREVAHSFCALTKGDRVGGGFKRTGTRQVSRALNRTRLVHAKVLSMQKGVSRGVTRMNKAH